MFLSEQRGDVFGGGDQDDHHGGDLDALPVAEEGPVVDQHAYADQEEGDEDGVATNSMRFIRGEVRGMRRLRASPARKAPMIGSSPARCAR